jgi:hypothetical protein
MWLGNGNFFPFPLLKESKAMSERRLLDMHDGVATYFEHDAKEGRNIFTHIQDVEPFVEWNKHAGEHLDKRENWWFVGTIPDTVVLQWAKECDAKPYSKKWRHYAAKKMNDPDYRKLNPNKIKVSTKEA